MKRPNRKLSQGPAVAPQNFLSNVLHLAVQRDDLDKVNSLLKTFPNVDVLNPLEQTPLHHAASKGSVPIVKALIKAGATVAPRDVNLWSPLHHASVNGHLDVVKYLIKCGHDPNSRNCDRNVALHYLVRLPWSLKLENVLNKTIKAGAVIDSLNKFDDTPLLTAAARGTVEAILYLLGKKADINARNKFGETALQKAVVLGRPSIVFCLLENGANPTLKSEGVYGDMIRTATLAGNQTILQALEYFSMLWKMKNPGEAKDEEWKAFPKDVRIRKSPIIDLSHATEQEIVQIAESEHLLVSDQHDGWIADHGVLQVPKPLRGIEVLFPTAVFSTYFFCKDHASYHGQIFRGKKGEPIVVSVGGEISEHDEHRIIVWMTSECVHLSISKEFVDLQDSSGKKLAKFVLSFINERNNARGLLEEDWDDLRIEKISGSNHQSVASKLRSFEASDPQMPVRLNCGVVYCHGKDKTEEDYFEHDHTSHTKEFLALLDCLGQTVPLEGHQGHNGDLDTGPTKNHGTQTVYLKDDNFEIIFHVATFLPSFRDEEGQQMVRKRFIGNDVVVIIFQDGDGPIPALIRSQFIHLYIIVAPVYFGGILHFRVNTLRNETVSPFGPDFSQPTIMTQKNLHFFLISKIINGQWSCLRSPKLAQILVKRVKLHQLESLSSLGLSPVKRSSNDSESKRLSV